VSTSLRVAVIGCGAIAQRAHIPGLLAAGATITALASRSRASVDAAAGIAGCRSVTLDWQDAVARDDVDAVAICTPNDLHEPIAIAAASAGKHVLVEKPMATTLEGADRMIAAATRAGGVLLPAHNVRFLPPFVAAADSVRRGDIGRVTGVRAAFGHAGPQHWAPAATWFRDRGRSGGGALIDLGVHVADLLRAVVGDEIGSVAASVTRDADPDGVDVDAHVLVRFAGGAVGSFHASWISCPGPDHQLTVIGTEGTLHLDSRTPLTLFRGDGSKGDRVPPPAITTNPFEQLVCAARGDAPAITAADGRASLAIVVAAYEAAQTGRFVDVDRSAP
jgi:predicted dehydrogenase